MVMRNIHITVVAHSLASELKMLVESCSGPGVTWHVFLHSRKTDVVEACDYLNNVRNDVLLYRFGTNRGLARSWNDGLIMARKLGAEVTMIANDDVAASYDDVQRIADAAIANRDCYFISGDGFDKTTNERKQMLFALAAINPIAIQTIGYFDEQFCPIYFEDLDYYRRAELAGLKPFFLLGTNIVHVGSGTRKAQPEEEAQFWTDFERNKAYYIHKWGGSGDRGTETFDRPFNNPASSLYQTRGVIG